MIGSLVTAMAGALALVVPLGGQITLDQPKAGYDIAVYANIIDEPTWYVDYENKVIHSRECAGMSDTVFELLGSPDNLVLHGYELCEVCGGYHS